MDIKKIPIEELQKDRDESFADIKVCKLAIIIGVTTYSGGLVEERLDINKKIVEKIDEELKTRGKTNNEQ